MTPRRIAGPSRSSCQTPRKQSASGCVRARRVLGFDRAGSPLKIGVARLFPIGQQTVRAKRGARLRAPRPAADEDRRARTASRRESASAGTRSPAHARNDWGSPSQPTRPCSSAITRSAAVRQRSRRCSASRIVVSHSWFSRRNSPINSSPATGSSCDVGSSSSTIRGLPASAAPRATRCFSPPDRSCVERSSSESMPSASATSSTPRATAAAAVAPALQGERQLRAHRAHHELGLGVLEQHAR